MPLNQGSKTATPGESTRSGSASGEIIPDLDAGEFLFYPGVMKPEPADPDGAVPLREQVASASAAPEDLWRDTKTVDGRSVADLSGNAPVLLIFLRHSGCTFCRQTLSDLAHVRARLEAAGVQPVVVHMSPPSEFAATLREYQLEDVEQISDPERHLYQGLGLKRGGAGQLLGWRVWWRGFLAAVLQRHGAGKIVGDVRQMPGLFLISQGKVVKEFRHSYSSDRPDLLGFVHGKT